MAESVSDQYLNPASIGSFGGVERLKKVLPQHSREQLQQRLLTHSSYTKFKKVRKSFVRRKYNIHTSNYLWQIDLIVLLKFARSNRNYKYILSCIDCFSRKAYAAPVKSKKCTDVLNGFKFILQTANTKPKFIQSDLGNEFYGRIFKQFLTENQIHLYSNHSDLKACIVERWNQTLMNRIVRWFDYTRKNNWIDHLQQFVQSYNNTKHRTLGCAPNQVTKFNELDVWLNINKDLYNTNKYDRKAELKVGDFVRLKQNKKTFDKGYSQNFTDSIYQVKEVLSTKPVTYRILDSEGDSLKGIFYPQELSKVHLK